MANDTFHTICSTIEADLDRLEADMAEAGRNEVATRRAEAGELSVDVPRLAAPKLPTFDAPDTIPDNEKPCASCGEELNDDAYDLCDDCYRDSRDDRDTEPQLTIDDLNEILVTECSRRDWF